MSQLDVFLATLAQRTAHSMLSTEASVKEAWGWQGEVKRGGEKELAENFPCVG